MKKSYLQKMIAALLTAALLVGVLPIGALATEAESPGTEDSYEEPLQYTPQDILQAGVSDVTANVEGPRTREELLALDSVVLSEEGKPVAIRGSKDNITVEEMNILFSRPASYALRGESDPNQELREKFGLTDADIELGSNLHGSRLVYTTELGNLAIKAQYLNISETQMDALVDLISSGYSCYHAMRALAAKDLIGFTLDELKTARQQEIQAEEQEEAEEAELAVQEEADESNSPDIVGLPTVLAERAVETTGKDAQSVEQDITAAMQQAYSTPADDEDGALMAAAASQEVTYAPEEVLGQPYRYAQQGNFNVNLNTGAYSYSETDLSIPGKNGLDLVLTRQYHSDWANTKENVSVMAGTATSLPRQTAGAGRPTIPTMA